MAPSSLSLSYLVWCLTCKENEERVEFQQEIKEGAVAEGNHRETLNQPEAPVPLSAGAPQPSIQQG